MGKKEEDGLIKKKGVTMRKVIVLVGMVCLLGLLASPVYSWQFPGWGPSNELLLQGYKYHYFPVSYTSATVAEVGGDAQALGCAGLGAGATEIGTTAGYVRMAENADILRFRFRLPQTFVDTGNQDDLILQIHATEQTTEDAITYDVAIYEYGSTTPIFEDTFTLFNGDSKQWYNLDTYAAGIGDDADIDGDDVLIITISPEDSGTQTNAADIHAIRLKYRAGIFATE